MTGATVPDPERPRDRPMPLFEHLRELRRRLVVSLVALGIGVGVTFAFVDRAWDLLARPLATPLAARGLDRLAVLAPTEGIQAWLTLSLWGGAVLAAPVVLQQAWAFVAPGLYPREQRIALPVVAAAWVLAVAGVAFGWAALLPPAAHLFLAAVPDGVEPVLSMRAWLRTAATLLGACGLSFQIPLAIFLLARLGILDARGLVRGFRFAVLGIFALAAVLTPPDVLSQLLLAVPLVLLYGVGVLVAALASPRTRPPRAPAAPPG